MGSGSWVGGGVYQAAASSPAAAAERRRWSLETFLVAMPEFRRRSFQFSVPFSFLNLQPKKSRFGLGFLIILGRPIFKIIF